MIFNEYLKQISPIIKKYDGFVSKFLSGGFMALFPNSELDAVRAALEINDCTQKLNNQENFSKHKLTSWIGIHYGRMIIGTIGEENRMDDTVISDTVNTAARIESVCEKLGKNIIISQVLQKKISQEKTIQINLTELDAMYVKGKEKPLQLFEVTRHSNKNQETQ
jgi:class 3 adenylate cyclase